MNEEIGCYCDSGESFMSCCEPCISGTHPASTAVALMRSRYSAFYLGNSGYLLKSWHSTTRPSRVNINPDQDWISLKILSTSSGQVGDQSGEVEFVARYKIAGRGVRLQELSRFVFEQEHWFYVDGDHRQ